jgi:secondary thiamine-phosphate synthase enzyme
MTDLKPVDPLVDETMATYLEHLRITTHRREEMIDITRSIEDVVGRSGITRGSCTVQSVHTTCGLTINENADPDVKADILEQLASLIPQDGHFRHPEGNSDAHVKTSLVGVSHAVAIEASRLALGTWQGIMLCEFDGPRSREVIVVVQGD